mgnify:CR=1 FL=1
MLTVFLIIYGSFVFIDLARWIWSEDYLKPNLLYWMTQSIISNAFWAFIATLLIKLGMWLFS